MKWKRNASKLEVLMVQVLRQAKKELSLDEITNRIITIDPSAFTGTTPKNSLYSVIYRREKRRAERNQEPLFKTRNENGKILYSLDNDQKVSAAGKKIG